MVQAQASGEAVLRKDILRTRDPFALELIKNSLVTLADEMALTVSRTARSTYGTSTSSRRRCAAAATSSRRWASSAR